MSPSSASLATVLQPSGLATATPADMPSAHQHIEHSVNFWAGEASDRRLLHVASDVDHCRLKLHGLSAVLSSPQLCIHAARSGARVRNFIVKGAWLVFEPEEGRGTYELYSHCEATSPDLHSEIAAPEKEWKAEALRGLAVDPFIFAPALLTTRETRGAIMGPPWRDTFEDNAHWGAHRMSVGNVRARVMVSNATAAYGAVRVLVPWRRQPWPARTDLRTFCGPMQSPVQNVRLVSDGREAAEVLLDTSCGAGEYDLYFLPHTARWEAFDARDDKHGVRYDQHYDTCDRDWCAQQVARTDLPRAHVFDIQSRTHRDRADAMGRPATKAEVAAHLRAATNATAGRVPPPRWLLFPESRQWPLKLRCELPERWAISTPTRALASAARPGEAYGWQIGVFASSFVDVLVSGARVDSAVWRLPSAQSGGGSRHSSGSSSDGSSDGRNNDASRRDIESDDGGDGAGGDEFVGPTLPVNISSLSFRAYNLGGVSHHGEPFSKTVLIRSGCARSLWFSVDVPDPPMSVGGGTKGGWQAAAPILELGIRLVMRAVPADPAAAAATEKVFDDMNGAPHSEMKTPRAVRSHLLLEVRGARLADRGDSRAWRLSRLRWLDSTAGAEPAVPHPFTPVAIATAVERSASEASLSTAASAVKRAMTETVSAFTGSAAYRFYDPPALTLSSRMGRVELSAHGLPMQLFAGVGADTTAEPATPSTKAALAKGHSLLNMPMRFDVSLGADGFAKPKSSASALEWRVLEPLAITSRRDDVVRWKARLAPRHHEHSSLRLDVRGEWWFDSSASFNLTLANVGMAPLELEQTELVLDWSVAKFLMGLGEAGNLLESVAPKEWSWRAGLGNYMVWMGDVHAGMRLRLVGDAQNFESSQHILTADELPASWHNGGQGGVHVSKRARVRAYGGARKLEPAGHEGDAVSFGFELLLTPCKPLDPTTHWQQRYYQVGYPTARLVQPDEVAATGATVLNIHQGVDGLLNPYINYPFDARTTAHLSSYIATAHAHALRVKAYYTIRELSNYADELWVLRSLGDEILTSGHGGGDAWAQEHLVDDYAACWQTPLSDGTFDSALCTRGISRWINYYIEGLGRLFRPPVGLDGIYYDGIGFGVHTMRRVRRTLDTEHGPGRGLIDLHCGNNLLGTQYGEVSPQLQFMHLMPYIDSLWFGEGYDYRGSSPAYWMVEVSGIPFGLMGDMMHEGHVWRGMLYGMYARPPGANPIPLWQLWDAFGMRDAVMHGYWQTRAPVASSCEGVLVTSYVRYGNATLVAIASWDAEPRTCTLIINYAALGFSPPRVRIYYPDLTALGQSGMEVELRSDGILSYSPQVLFGANDGAILIVERR